MSCVRRACSTAHAHKCQCDACGMRVGMHSSMYLDRARGTLVRVVRVHLFISIVMCACVRAMVNFYAYYPCGVRAVLHALICMCVACGVRVGIRFFACMCLVLRYVGGSYTFISFVMRKRAPKDLQTMKM